MTSALDTTANAHPSIVTIGSFDGVHRGHQALLVQAAARAESLGLPLKVVTFEPLPSQVIRPESFAGRLSSAEEKLDRLAGASGGVVLKIPFDDVLMKTSADAFLTSLVNLAAPVEIWVGEEFALGHLRSGTLEKMASIGSRLGFTVSPFSRLQLEGGLVSSSRIRDAIHHGQVDLAERLLGYPFAIRGVVVHGAQVGRTIGYPTANVEPPVDIVALADGIYASVARIEGDPAPRPAMTYIGTRPALNTGSRLIETHLLGFTGDLYDQILHTEMISRLRPDATFDSVQELVAQLDVDAINATEALETRGIRVDPQPEGAPIKPSHR